MLDDIKTVLALLDKVQVEGSTSVKALGAAMCRLEMIRDKIAEARRQKEVTADEHSDGNDLQN